MFAYHAALLLMMYQGWLAVEEYIDRTFYLQTTVQPKLQSAGHQLCVPIRYFTVLLLQSCLLTFLVDSLLICEFGIFIFWFLSIDFISTAFDIRVMSNEHLSLSIYFLVGLFRFLICFSVSVYC